MRKGVIILFFLIFIFFALKSASFLDPDFGWHIRTGEIITTIGIPRTDPFSYTMSNFPFVSHSWLSDTLIYIIHETLSYSSLIYLFAAIGVLTVYISTRKFTILSPLVAATLLPTLGVRVQIISFLFFSILLSVYPKINGYVKSLLLIFFFALWANLHGGYLVGVVYLFIQVLDPQINSIGRVKRGILAGTCLVATTFNPYGYQLFNTVFSLVSNRTSPTYISEWSFNPQGQTIAFALLSVLVFSTIYRYKATFRYFEMVFPLILFIMSVVSLRYSPLFAIASVPIVAKGFLQLKIEASKIHLANRRFQMVQHSLHGLFILLFIVESMVSLHQYSRYQTQIYYPAKAVEYLTQHPEDGNLFSTYNWGGYLDWKYPQKKVFIDGRMDSWVQNRPNNNDTRSAFQSYLSIIMSSGDYELMRKFNINTILWSKKEPNPFISSLLEHNWKIAYEDDISVVYIRPLVPMCGDSYN